MQLCSGTSKVTHSEICYENNDCPLCEALEELIDKEKEVEEAEKKVVEFEDLVNQNQELRDAYLAQKAANVM